MILAQDENGRITNFFDFNVAAKAGNGLGYYGMSADLTAFSGTIDEYYKLMRLKVAGFLVVVT